jgi:hypothetical protein
LILFAQFGPVSIGTYLGKGLQNKDTSSFTLPAFANYSKSIGKSAGTVAMQFCQPEIDSDHVFGIMATSNYSFTPIQAALQSWSNATCLNFANATNTTGPAFLTTPLYLDLPQNGILNSTVSGTNSTINTFRKRSLPRRIEGNERLQRRDDCTTIVVAAGDGCSSLAQKCGCSQTQFEHYNPAGASCGPTSFQPGQHVCCTPGTLPDYAPQPNADGSCASYTIQTGDNCATLAATYSITQGE